MESKKKLYLAAELDVVEIKISDVIATSGETGDSFEWVDGNPNSWDS